MKIPDTSHVMGALVIKTKQAVYGTCYANGMVAVRVLGDPTGVAGSWIDRPPVTSDWRETAHLMIAEWEHGLNQLIILKHANRNVVWAAALKRGTMVLDYFLDNLWYATVWSPKEVC
jgi:hypothetical protein